MPQENIEEHDEKHDEEHTEKQEPTIKNLCTNKKYESLNVPPYTWYPSVGNVQQISYVRRLECEHELLQASLLTVTSQMARLQFRIRQIISADPCDRTKMIADLERVVFKEFYSLSECPEDLPLVERHHQQMGDIRARQHSLIHNLRYRITDFKTASDGVPLETDLDTDWETYVEKACNCPCRAREDDESGEGARKSRYSRSKVSIADNSPDEPKTRYSKSKLSLRSSRTSLFSRKSAGWDQDCEDTISTASQTDLTFGSYMSRESRI